MEDTAAFLAADLKRLFETGQITESRYAENIIFEDPITRHDTRSGYVFNINMLRTLFNITFDLHTIAVSSADTVTARWSMSMQMWMLPWKPEFVFTGRTVYTVEPDTGLVIKHVDYWDALKRNAFLSLEAVQHIIKQTMQTMQLTPSIETPKYTVLQRYNEYEIRKYEDYAVASSPMPAGAGPASGSGFNDLAGYIFGGNAAALAMDMTTPVLTTVDPSQTSMAMKFVMENRFVADLSKLPAPRDARITTQVEAGGYVAALRFSGWPLDYEVVAAERALREALLRDGHAPPPGGYSLGRYNEPTVPPFLRRNEVLMPLPAFVWPPEGSQ